MVMQGALRRPLATALTEPLQVEIAAKACDLGGFSALASLVW
jgi:hypothetical protein